MAEQLSTEIDRLTRDIELAFVGNLVIGGAVFVDLTAAYDTVWRRSVMLKLLTFSSESTHGALHFRAHLKPQVMTNKTSTVASNNDLLCRPCSSTVA